MQVLSSAFEHFNCGLCAVLQLSGVGCRGSSGMRSGGGEVLFWADTILAPAVRFEGRWKSRGAGQGCSDASGFNTSG